MATINPSQDYDCILTISLTTGSGNLPVKFIRGSTASITSGTFYYRMGTSGAWTSATMADPRNISYTSSTMQIGFDWSKSGNNYATPYLASIGGLAEVAISQKAPLSGVIGSHFMYGFASYCGSVIALDVPDISGVTEVGNSFLCFYGLFCSSLISLSAPDPSKISAVGSGFMQSYAHGCKALTSLPVPALDSLSFGAVPTSFMQNFASGGDSLEEVLLPDSPNIYAGFNINWNVPAGRSLVGKTNNGPGWSPLLVSGKTLHTNKVTSLEVSTPPAPPPPNAFSLKLYHEGNWLSLAMPA